MTKKETAMLMAVLKAAYPAYYKGQSEDEAIAAARLWYEMFADDPYGEVAAAVKMLIATKVEGYPPTIGAVKEKLAQLRRPNEMDAQDAWALAAKAAAGNLAWEKLPPQVQRAIGSQSVLRDWGMMETEVFNSVVYSQFVKAYRAHQQRERDMAMIPSDVKKLLGAMSERLALTDKSETAEGDAAAWRQNQYTER